MQTTQLPHINQRTIECDLSAFTRWVNDVVDQVNWCTNVYAALKDTVEDHGYRINALENKVTEIEATIGTISEALADLDERVTALENSGTGGAIEVLNTRIDLLYSWLPAPYGSITGKGWKFAMGNISVMSNQNEPSATTGPGIYTSVNVEDNDVAFN